jgi:hypothetical protein
LGRTRVGNRGGYVLIVLVVDRYAQEQAHTPLDPRKLIGYGPISAGDSERFRLCFAGTSKYAVGTLLSERELWLVGGDGLSISNRRVAEKSKSQQDQGESNYLRS